jgi:predicted glutamine amidotransferase
MCRMFAVRSEEPVRVTQAFAGLRRLAVEHKDGWGLARFDDATPTIETALAAAHECPRFLALGEAVETRSLLVHIRKASVGSVHPDNTHPFVARGWAFMHNGTLSQFEARRADLEQELAPRWRTSLKGETDSERCFGLFLTYLDDIARPTARDVARTLARVMRTVERVCDRPGEARSAMNFLVGDGHSVVATRRGRTLFTAHREGRSFLASEALWPGEDWAEVPEEHLVLIDGPRRASVTPLAEWL